MESYIRKVQQLKNNGSYLLTLPKEWCDENGLDKNNEIELIVDKVTPKSILIQLPTDEVDRSTELVLNDRDHSTGAARRRAILGGYLEGYDKITLINVSRKSRKRLEIREDIQQLAQKLDGCSTSEEEKKFELTIAEGIRSPEELLKRLFSTTKLMFEDVFLAYLDFDEILAKDLIQRDDQADKLYFSMVRTLKLILREPFKVTGEKFKLVDTLDYRMVASNLENLCDAAEYVAQAIRGENEQDHNIDKEHVAKLSKPSRSRIEEIASTLSDALENAFAYYSHSDEPSAVDMASRKPEMDEFLPELKEIGVHQSLIEVVDEAVETIVDLLELVHANPEELDRK